MTKAELEKAVVEVLALNGIKATHKAVADVISATLDVITGELAGGAPVRLTGFGAFKATRRTARIGRNPKTGEPVEIPASTGVKFSPGKTLKEALN
jgi:nucleoid DNA-binding protein